MSAINTSEELPATIAADSGPSAATVGPYDNPFASSQVHNPAPQSKGRRDISLGGMALIDQVVVSGTNFLTVALIANLGTRAELGLFSLAWTIVGFLRTAQERILSAPYLVFAHREETDAKSFLGSSLSHQAGFAVCGSLVVAMCAVLFATKNEPPGMAPVMVALIVSLPFLLLRDHIRAICSAHFRYDISLIINASVAAVQLSTIGLLAWFGKLSIPAVVVCLGGACLVPVLIWLRRRPQPYRIDRGKIRPDWSVTWNYSRWLVAARLAGMAGFLLVPWIVVAAMDTAAAGAFAACSNLVGLSLMFITGMNNFFQPRSIRAFHDEGPTALARSVVETVVVFGAALGVVSLAFYFSGDFLLGLIYGADFGQFGDVAFYLSVSMLTVCVSIASGNGLAALGKPKGYFLGEVAYCVVSISLALFLIPGYGLLGASWALVGGGMAASVIASVTLASLIRDLPAHDAVPTLDASASAGSEWRS